MEPNITIQVILVVSALVVGGLWLFLRRRRG